MSWENAPHPIRNSSLRETIGVDAIVAAEHEPVIESELRNHGYRLRDSGGGVNLWCRGEDLKAYPVQVGRGYMRELLSLSAFVAFLACCCFESGCEGAVVGIVMLSVVMYVVGGVLGLVSPWSSLVAVLIAMGFVLLWKRHVSCCFGRLSSTPSVVVGGGTLLVMVAFIILYASLALAHTFVAPNGLGTVGGRAKLMFLSGGIGEGFFTDPAFALLQPAYPLGAASLVLWCDALSGFCGEWIIQLLPCVLMATMAGFFMSRLRNALGMLVVFVVFTTPVSIRLATLFYPEVYVAIYCLIGWERIRKNRLDYIGWLLIGVSGWFKNEGLVYFCSVATAVLVVPPYVGFRRLAARVALGAVLPMTWHLGCRLAGASHDGYLPLEQLRIDQFVSAAYRAIQYMFCSAWWYAFMFPLALVMVLVPRWRNRNLTMVVVGVAFAVAAFAFVFSLSAATDFEWHLDSLERLLWVPSLLMLRELGCVFGSADRGASHEPR